MSDPARNFDQPTQPDSGPVDGGGARLGIAALLTGTFMVAEVAGGLVSGSLALIADAGHMFTDFASLALAWFATRLANRPASWKRTYGFDRFSVLVAFVNGLALFGIAALILVEAARRIAAPIDVAGPLMLGVAAAGLVVNVAAFRVLHVGEGASLNLRAAALHVLGDLLGSLAAIVAAAIIIATGWTLADPILSVLVVLIILRSARTVVRNSAHILLEAAPPQLDTREIASDLAAHVDGAEDIHHVHAWSISEERPMVTLHARLAVDHRPDTVIAAIKARLADRFGVTHATVEIEFGECADAEPAAGR